MKLLIVVLTSILPLLLQGCSSYSGTVASALLRKAGLEMGTNAAVGATQAQAVNSQTVAENIPKLGKHCAQDEDINAVWDCRVQDGTGDIYLVLKREHNKKFEQRRALDKIEKAVKENLEPGLRVAGLAMGANPLPPELFEGGKLSVASVVGNPEDHYVGRHLRITKDETPE